jgi:hypothetical protein
LTSADAGFGFVALPAMLYGALAGVVSAYLLAAEVTKPLAIGASDPQQPAR